MSLLPVPLLLRLAGGTGGMCLAIEMSSNENFGIKPQEHNYDARGFVPPNIPRRGKHASFTAQLRQSQLSSLIGRLSTSCLP
jgi:hypothetical protein